MRKKMIQGRRGRFRNEASAIKEAEAIKRNAVYNELHRNEIINYPNPLSKVRPIKIKERELSYLDKDQIKELFETLNRVCINPHVILIAKVCLATGCRWGEAQNLNSRNIRNGKITFTDTKSGKNRSIPIDENSYKMN